MERRRGTQRDGAAEKDCIVCRAKDTTDNVSLCLCHDSSTQNSLLINRHTEAAHSWPHRLYQQLEERLKIVNPETSL